MTVETFLMRCRTDKLAPEYQAGDWLTVCQQGTAKPDQLVVAAVDGEATLAHWAPGLQVLGVVVGMFRRLP